MSNFLRGVYTFRVPRTGVSKTASIGSTEAAADQEETVTGAVVDAVAAAAGVSPLQLEPIATVIDPDALNAVFRDGQTGVHVEFEYCGYVVSVADSTDISVTPDGS